MIPAASQLQVTTAAAEERRAPPLAAVEWGYLVGKRRPLSELPPEKQEQIRQAYEDTDWAVSNLDTDVEFLGFTADEETARQKAASLEGGFWCKLPVGGWLPERPGRYTVQVHNAAEARYRETSPGLELVDRSHMKELGQILKRAARVGV